MRPMRYLFAVVLFVLVGGAAVAQTDTSRPRHWYDTLTVTEPRFARVTPMERLALSAFSLLSIPVALVVGGSTIMPPSIPFLTERGVEHTGVAVGFGFAFGGDTNQLTWFPTVRAQAEFAYFFDRTPSPLYRISLLHDFILFPLGRRALFSSTTSWGLGVATDLERVQPYVEGFIGIANPMGIRFVPLYPMHNYGLRARLGYDPVDNKPWYELSLCATATFQWMF